MKKTEVRKSHATVPLNEVMDILNIPYIDLPLGDTSLQGRYVTCDIPIPGRTNQLDKTSGPNCITGTLQPMDIKSRLRKYSISKFYEIIKGVISQDWSG